MTPDPAFLALLFAQMMARNANPPRVSPVHEPPAGATPEQRHKHYKRFGAPLKERKSKAQVEADKRARQIGFSNGRRVA